MLILITIALTVIALLLLLRFVQPELIYSIRRGLVMVASNKAIIDKVAGRDNLNAVFQQVLVSDFRLESRAYDEMNILQDRVVKISELYRLLDSRRKTSKLQNPQVCIVELGALLSNLGREVEVNPEHNAPIVKSGALLKYIADGILTSRNENALAEKAVDRWFIKNPISIEQVVELLIASVVALAHRRQATRSPESGIDIMAEEQVDVWSEINAVEKGLRLFVRARLQQKYKVEYSINNRVKESLGDESYQASLGRMEDVRKKRPDLALDFFDFVYWVQLEQLILGEWDVFQAIFGEKEWLTTRVKHIIAVRHEEAENRRISDDDKEKSVGYCREIRNRTEKLP